mmetsp:Transcript_59255/g.67451  ORF Transcript_59255/g.67451 Transcript_59255/m.67451 type:complete len:323 (+) Transcript_59255:120-1088(+)
MSLGSRLRQATKCQSPPYSILRQEDFCDAQPTLLNDAELEEEEDDVVIFADADVPKQRISYANTFSRLSFVVLFLSFVLANMQYHHTKAGNLPVEKLANNIGFSLDDVHTMVHNGNLFIQLGLLLAFLLAYLAFYCHLKRIGKLFNYLEAEGRCKSIAFASGSIWTAFVFLVIFVTAGDIRIIDYKGIQIDMHLVSMFFFSVFTLTPFILSVKADIFLKEDKVWGFQFRDRDIFLKKTCLVFGILTNLTWIVFSVLRLAKAPIRLPQVDVEFIITVSNYSYLLIYTLFVSLHDIDLRFISFNLHFGNLFLCKPRKDPHYTTF